MNAVKIGSKQRHGRGIFAFFGSGFAQSFRQIVSIRIETAIQIWQRQGVLKEKRPHYGLMCFSAQPSYY